jgi:hypothetical protein
METTTKEIAALLRSTEQMADRFVQRVRTRVGEPVLDEEILAAMKKISAKSLSMEKVVAKVQRQLKSTRRRTQRATVINQPNRASPNPSDPSAISPTPRPATASVPRPQTSKDQLETLLEKNWNRASKEGLRPDRMPAEAFVKAIFQHTDRRVATQRRILQAARQLNADDVVLTPALVADAVLAIFEN